VILFSNNMKEEEIKMKIRNLFEEMKQEHSEKEDKA